MRLSRGRLLRLPPMQKAMRWSRCRAWAPRWPLLRITAHVVESASVFYPRADAAMVRREVAQGVPIPSGVVPGMMQRMGKRIGGQWSGYVLHRERTGIWVLALDGGTNEPGPDVPTRDLYVAAVTFLRFYSLDQHRAAVALYGRGDPMSGDCAARWTPDPIPARPVPDLAAVVRRTTGTTAVPMPTHPHSCVKGKILQGIVDVEHVQVAGAPARALGGRSMIRWRLLDALTNTRPLPANWPRPPDLGRNVQPDDHVLAYVDLGFGPLVLVRRAGIVRLWFAKDPASPAKQALPPWPGQRVARSEAESA